MPRRRLLRGGPPAGSWYPRRFGGALRNQLAQFGYLQLLDLLTTLACMSHGVEESNPLVGKLMAAAGSPRAGLWITKILAFAVALYCWRRSREKLL